MIKESLPPSKIASIYSVWTNLAYEAYQANGICETCYIKLLKIETECKMCETIRILVGLQGEPKKEIEYKKQYNTKKKRK